MRSRRFPGVVFVEGPAGRRAHLAGTGLDVWEVVELVREYRSPEATMRAFPRLPRTAILTATAYADEYPEEINTFLELNARSPGALRQDRVLVTFNVVDFVELTRELARTSRAHAGVIPTVSPGGTGNL